MDPVMGSPLIAARVQVEAMKNTPSNFNITNPEIRDAFKPRRPRSTQPGAPFGVNVQDREPGPPGIPVFWPKPNLIDGPFRLQ
ncbi:MAG: hypothetical protein RLZZ313_1069, partial [Verrucomicrobiota bacterium]